MNYRKVGLAIAKELTLGMVVVALASTIAMAAGILKQYIYGNIVESLMTIALEASLIGYGLGRYVAYRKSKLFAQQKDGE